MANNFTRRKFLITSGLAACALNLKIDAQENAQPNILWITSEDNGPELGCYGHKDAHTPNLDKLAGKGTLFENFFSNAPVCAPARSTIITGMYPPAIGSEHMRSRATLPDNIKFYTNYLRENGYYCCNKSKEDYNLNKPKDCWDESGRKASYKKRKPGQPFFSITNLTISHESRIRSNLKTELRLDPATVTVPPYHPDTPEVRRDWANYHHNITLMDTQAGQILDQLEQDGEAENTIIFYYGDHGSGMPRGKRWLYDSGLRVPLLIHVPEKFKHLALTKPGGKTDRLTSFVDLGPTVLSIIGAKVPRHMHGEAFMGKAAKSPRKYVYGYRSRMDERIDCSRAVRDKEFLYLVNYYPNLPQGQYLDYMFKTPTTAIWKKLYDEGKLNDAQKAFFSPKPMEELFEIKNDPYNINNLAKDKKYKKVLTRMRKAHHEWALEIRDLGFCPEGEMQIESPDNIFYNFSQDKKRYPLERIFDVVDEIRDENFSPVSKKSKAWLKDENNIIRYWVWVGIWMRKTKISDELITTGLKDSCADVRIVAAEIAARQGRVADSIKVLKTELKSEIYGVQIHAGNAIDRLDEKAKPMVGQMEQAIKANQKKKYIVRLMEKALSDF